MSRVRACIVIPYFNHPAAIGATLAGLAPLGLPCWIADDGSDAAGAAALQAAAQTHAGWVQVLRDERNRGKGAAVLRACRAAAAAGCTHALQVDADGQHTLADAPRLLRAAARYPDALVLGLPQFDASVPRARLHGRRITHVWVWINTLSLAIRDTMCGFRVYPLAALLELVASERMGQRMEFDTEVVVRLAWRGVDVVNVPTAVRYPLDGVSHFDLWRDNVRISAMHTRLFFGMLWRLPRLLWRGRVRALTAGDSR